MTVTVLLADDHPIVRQGLRHLLEAEPDLKIVGEAEDGLQAVQLTEKLRPNVLIVDIMMPGLNGLEVLRQVKDRSPATCSIVLSMQSADVYVVEALKSGALGYVLKETGPSELVNAVQQVLVRLALQIERGRSEGGRMYPGPNLCRYHVVAVEVPG